MNPFSLENKTVLITGGSSGIGQGIAISCSALGADIVVTARSAERLQQTIDLAEGGVAIAADLLSVAETDNLVAKLPVLSGVVLCAGMNKKEPVNFVSEESINAIMSTNFISNVMLIKKLLKAKRIAKGASIVFVSSISVDTPAMGNAIYAASKGAVNSYARVLALELSGKNIRVNCVEPGMVRTPWLEKSATTPEQFARDEARYPLGRYGTPEDVANAAIYLLSDASSWTTGSSIRLDGGISLL